MSLKAFAKRWFCRAAPETATAFFSARARRWAQKCYADWGCLALNKKIAERHGPRVQTGPFAGLILSPATFAEHLGPYLLGTYESELHPAWHEIMRGNASQIVDIGAKFGYYAAGLARHFPGAQAIAFDTDSWARSAISEMIAANQIGNVAVRSFCSPEILRSELKPGAFVLSDCEGYESILFAKCDGHLRSATLLIELHEHLSPGATRKISQAFSATHRIVAIPTQPRTALPECLALFTPDEQALALQEFRNSDQSWLWLVPRPPA